MATLQTVNLGSVPNDPSADTFRVAFQKVMNNETVIFNALSDISGSPAIIVAAKDTAVAASIAAQNAQTAAESARDAVLATQAGQGVNYVVVNASADSASVNGANLLAAYALAKTLTPNGSALSATNRAVVLIPPGVYDTGATSLLLDTQFVDIIGSTGHWSHVRIVSAVTALNQGTITQTASDVMIVGVTLENRQETYVPTTFDTSTPSAYHPSTYMNNTVMRFVKIKRGSNHYGSRSGIVYTGTYIDCDFSDCSFAATLEDSTTFAGAAIRCVMGAYALGGANLVTGVFSGYAEFCLSYGPNNGVPLSGIGVDGAYGGFGGSCSGMIIDCAGGDQAFGGAGVCSATLIRCLGRDGSFGGAGGTFSGKAYDCDVTSDGFGSGGVCSGLAHNCRQVAGRNATADSFGGNGGVLRGRLRNCSIEGPLAPGCTGTFPSLQARTATITIANPGVITLTGHGYDLDTAIRFTTTGALPTGIVAGTTYYVRSGATANTFTISATWNGAAIVTSGTQSGVHTVRSGRVTQCIDALDNVTNQ